MVIYHDRYGLGSQIMAAVLAGTNHPKTRHVHKVSVVLRVGGAEFRLGQGLDQPLDHEAGRVHRLGDRRKRPLAEAHETEPSPILLDKRGGEIARLAQALDIVKRVMGREDQPPAGLQRAQQPVDSAEPNSAITGRSSFVASPGAAPMIHVLAIITAKPGQRDTILAAFRANMPAVHAEAGCIEYAPAIDAEGAGAIQTKLGPDTFVAVEKWESLDALKAHAAAPHMAAYGAKTRELVASRVIHVLSPG